MYVIIVNTYNNERRQLLRTPLKQQCHPAGGVALCVYF